MATKARRGTAKATSATSDKPRCGLCGKARRLTKTECCGRWICDDEDKYVLFSYARNSCHRNHGRYTLCASHHNEGHDGAWQTCQRCRESFETEMYVYFGTNEHNFDKLPDPPSYEPTLCAQCQRVIRLGADGYSMKAGGYYCSKCTAEELAKSAKDRLAQKP